MINAHFKIVMAKPLLGPNLFPDKPLPGQNPCRENSATTGLVPPIRLGRHARRLPGNLAARDIA
jgi:hypothetical protein